MSIAVEDKLGFEELRRAQRSVLARLDRLRRRLRMHLLVEGLFWVATTTLALAAASLVADRLLRFDPPTRWALLAIALAAIGYVAFRKLVQPMLLPLENLDLAALVDRRAPGVGQQISNVLELPNLLGTPDSPSPSMVRAAVLECLVALDRRDLTGTLNQQRRKRLLALCGVWLGLALGFAVFFGDTASLWARRWLAGSTLRWPQHTYLNIVGLSDDGTLMVPRGELAVVQIDAKPSFAEDFAGRWRLSGRGEPLVVESDAAPASDPPEQIDVEYVLADGSKRRGTAAQFDASHFRYELPPLAEPAEMEITGGDDWLGPIRIEPIDRPSVRSLEIAATRPGTTAAETEKIGEGSTQLLYLPQTKLTLTLVSNQPLRSAEALDKGLPLGGWQRIDDHTYRVSWTMSEALALEFRLLSQRSGLVSKPYFLAVGVLKDREPRVTIRASGVGRRVTPVARIPLSIRANDDFALASLALDSELTTLTEDKPQVATSQQPLKKLAADGAPTLTEFAYDKPLELKEKKLAPGSSLRLRGIATDACALGAQTGQSRWVTFQIVTPDELFYDILMRQREQRAKFAVALESEKAQRKAIADLARPEEISALVRAQQVINRQVFQIAGQLDATLEEMTLNDLGNPQARDNLKTAIIEPMRALHEDLLAKLRISFDALVAEEEIAPAGREASLALANQAIDKMQAILAQMSLWESFVDVINQLKHVIDAQSGVLKDTQDADKQRTDDLFDDDKKEPPPAPEDKPADKTDQ